jgi:hypothetical protein
VISCSAFVCKRLFIVNYVDRYDDAIKQLTSLTWTQGLPVMFSFRVWLLFRQLVSVAFVTLTLVALPAPPSEGEEDTTWYQAAGAG